jgi:hypothetical protein
MKRNPLPETIYLLPAYGRNYKTANQALKDWYGGKDFQIYNGPYCSIRDVESIKDVYPTLRILFDANSDSIEI